MWQFWFWSCELSQLVDGSMSRSVVHHPGRVCLFGCDTGDIGGIAGWRFNPGYVQGCALEGEVLIRSGLDAMVRIRLRRGCVMVMVVRDDLF